MPIEATWSAKIQRSISGFALLAAKRGDGKWKKGAQIPQHVRDYFLANARGLITDPGALVALKEKSKGAHSFTVTETIYETPKNPQAKYGPPPTLDWDDAEYVGDGNDGVYYGAVKKGGTWWALATVDSNTGGFVDSLATDGGYGSEKAARIAAKDAALDWCHTNDVDCD